MTLPEDKDRELGERLLPLLLDLNSKLVVVFGGGRVGERKARLFSDYAHVRVVAQDFAPKLKEMGEDLELVHSDLSSGFERYLDGAFIAIPATSDSELNRAIEQEASRLGILVNRVEGRGDVVVPSLIRKGPITIAISTESPGLSKYLRLRLEKELTENYQEMARLLGQIRRELKETVPEQKNRSGIIWEILEDEEVWRLLDVSYEKAYMRARSHACQDERDSLDACDPPQGLDRRD
jgi:precorrin-2 dehydrogenase/sirohydrochlorin ferrochelatase